RRPPLGRLAAALRPPAVIALELDKRLRMLRHKWDRRDDDANPVLPGPPDLLIDGRPQPSQRPDPALIADLPIRGPVFERVDDRRRRAFDLLRVGVALSHDLQWQAMRAQQQPLRSRHTS